MLFCICYHVFISDYISRTASCIIRINVLCHFTTGSAQVDKYVTHGHMISQCITRNVHDSINEIILLTHARHDMLIILLITIIRKERMNKYIFYLVTSCFLSPFSVTLKILCVKQSEKRVFFGPTFFNCEGWLTTRLIQEFEAISFEIVINWSRLILEIVL